MPQQKITITVDKDGKIVAYAQGFKGEATLDLLEELLDEDDTFMTHGVKDMFKSKVNVKSTKLVIQEHD